MDIERIRAEVDRVLSKRSQSSRTNTVTALNRFFNEYQKGQDLTFEQLLEEAQTDVKKTQDRLDGFYHWLIDKKGLLETSAYVSVQGYIRGFLIKQDVTFKSSWEPPKPSQIKQAIKNDNNVKFFTVDSKKRSIDFNRELMRKFLNNLKLRDKTIALALLSSGQDAGILFSLNVGDVKHQDGERIYWEANREKTKVHFQTFFSKEASQLVREYLETERPGAKDDEPLFVYPSKKRNQKKVTLQRMTANWLSSIFRDAAKTMKINQSNGDAKKGHNPLRPKRLRHLFRTACDTAGISEVYKNTFMGHKNGMGQSYSEFDAAILELEYLKVEPYLTVDGGGSEVSAAVKEEVTKLQNQIAEQNQRMDVQKEEIEVLSKKVLEQSERIKDLQTFMQRRVNKITKKLIEKRLPEIIEERINRGEYDIQASEENR